MLENPADTPALSAPNKRYVPPNQRNRRKSGDRSDGATTHSLPRSASDAESSRSSSQSQPQYISLSGCFSSEAFRLLRERWEAAINGCHDPSMASSERPVMYTGSVELPHQVVTMSSPRNQIDFLAELRRSIDEKRREERE